MIIVNQDKDNIINFDNLERIYIEAENKTIRADTMSQNNLRLGNYKTEERAKEVIQEIIKKYSDFNYLKFFPTNITKSVDQYMHTKYKHFDVYEMPKE